VQEHLPALPLPKLHQIVSIAVEISWTMQANPEALGQPRIRQSIRHSMSISHRELKLAGIRRGCSARRYTTDDVLHLSPPARSPLASCELNAERLHLSCINEPSESDELPESFSAQVAMERKAVEKSADESALTTRDHAWLQGRAL
jgi:hypothetical protein